MSRTVLMFGRPLWVGLLTIDMITEDVRNKAIMRAVLQRDVATQLGAYR